MNARVRDDPVVSFGGDEAALDWLISRRHSIRAFLSVPVDRGTIEGLLRVAARAPSGNNIQPWRVHVVTGVKRDALVNAVCAAFDHADDSHELEYAYYPTEFFEPYLGRRRRSGWGLYAHLGIEKGDRERMRVQTRRNFRFFDAPVGLVFTIDRRLGQGSWLDYGMFLQNVMLAAEARGLSTCAQAAWNPYHRIISEALGLGEHEQLVCGMALGYADPDAPENALVTERAPLSEFVVMHGEAAVAAH
ncbi:nitroreductase [Aromatoleum petrolei]|uniref:Nitroreductase n=1 Tax=Aromatoleum petrolei TaxID=76116 RepID=A0ABX1MRR4_9RHOO|nr:nitroreductase [Aromatoleum petrolei]NMF90668.1 nitroreductase [Aromatoleum petrolei]QTQ38774.1 Nitroreductase-like family protein [Aromatoleum petrolei]